MNQKLTIERLRAEAKLFCISESEIKNKDLYGITDGKTVGTYVEHKFGLGHENSENPVNSQLILNRLF